MRIYSSKKIHDEGASSVEFALLAGLLFSILFITIDFGIWSANQTVITGAARDGAIQFAMTGSANNALKTALTSGSSLSPDLAKSQVSLFISNSIDTLDSNPISTDSLDVSDRVCSAGQAIKVRITYPRTALVGTDILFPTQVIPAITAESVAVCE